MRTKGIYKTPNGKWKAFCYVMGKQKTKVTETYLGAVAWKKEQKLLAKKLKGSGGKRHNMPLCPELVTDLIDEYFKLLQKPPLKIAEFWRDHFEGLKVIDLVRAHFVLGKEKLLENGYKTSSINVFLSFIRQVVKRANLKYEFPPLALLESLKNETPPPFRNRILKPEEIEKLLEEAKRSRNPVIYNFLRIAFKTALRKMELLHLKFEDCCLKTKTIWIRKTKNRKDRIIPMAHEVEQILIALSSNATSKYIFGKKYSYAIVGVPFREICKKVGIKDFHIHDIRHNVITRLGHDGIDIKQLQHFSGHTNEQMTDRYFHFSKLFGHMEIKKSLDA